jgi:hypothetical protein
MAGSNSITDSGASYFLTLRSERPVEGCELTPNAFIQLKGGYLLDNSARAKVSIFERQNKQNIMI